MKSAAGTRASRRWDGGTGRHGRLAGGWATRLALLLCCSALPGASASAVAVRNVTWSAVGTIPSGRDLRFDLSWDDSWRSTGAPANWDAVWLFAKYRTVRGGPWRHAVLGTDARHGTVMDEHGVRATLAPTADGRGAFAYRRDEGRGPIRWTGVTLRWLTDGVKIPSEADLEVRVYALEMVYVPEGEFLVGDGVSPGRFHAGGKPTQPSRITATPPRLQNAAGGLWAERITAAAERGSSTRMPTWDKPSGPLPAAFPTGYKAFYIQKYEVTQGEYADFLNALTPPQASSRAPTWSEVQPARPTSRRRATARTDAQPLQRYSLALSTNGGYEATAPENACHYLSLDDALAFADWAGLRPMTETEFEKACRGSARKAVPGEYAWGSTRLVSMFDFQGVDGSGTETALPGDANTLCGRSMAGPVRVGIHEGRPTRELAGASYYGVLDLSGNLAERTVTLGNPEGRSYTGNHGDGELTADGEADVAFWPAGVFARTAAAERQRRSGRSGFGCRGGDWMSDAKELRVSTRNGATYATPRRHPAIGFRAVRSAAVR